MSAKSTNGKIPLGFKLLHTFQGNERKLNQIAWSLDGLQLASASDDRIIYLWEAQTGKLRQVLTENFSDVFSVAWSPDGQTLASGSRDQAIRLWNPDNGSLRRTLSVGSHIIKSLAWSPDGQIIACGSDDSIIRLLDLETKQQNLEIRQLPASRGGPWYTGLVLSMAWSLDGRILASGYTDHAIRLWDLETGQLRQTLEGHSGEVLSVAWSPDGRTLTSSSNDNTIRVWDYRIGREVNILEGHTSPVICISFSSDGRLLASKAQDGSVQLWRTDTWEAVSILNEPLSNTFFSNFYRWNVGAVFHPKEPILVTLHEEDTVIRIWDLDIDAILGGAPATPSVHYTNAKVVLLGDSGVGKSGLGLVLTAQPFVPTESTHGRHVWTFDSQEVELDSLRRETRETLLWDLAGQPGYRLIHQLHLNEVMVALVVFDAHSETDPFAGVYHWQRALRLAQRVQGKSTPAMRKFLVAARTDRGGKSVSYTRVESLVHELGFDRYFETSAKEGLNVAELAEEIKRAVDWEALPKVSSTNLFQHIKSFLVAEKEAGRLLSTVDDLFHTFLSTEKALAQTKGLRVQFETCIGRVESRGLIRRLSFGNFILLQPELLDAYASALINAVKDEPDGLGSIAEEKAQKGDFSIPSDERIKDKEQEKLLLIAMVEDLLRHEIALREQADGGPYLVFPSQSTRENPDLPDPEGKSIIFDFEGPILNIYTTLAVRLSHSGVFKKKDLWKNAATYATSRGGTYGIFLHNIGEGRGELTLFFDKAASEEMRSHFEAYVQAHLLRRALPESIQRRRIFVCLKCTTLFTDTQVMRRKELGFKSIRCSVCDAHVSLLDGEERLIAEHQSRVPEMDRAADIQRDRQAVASVSQGFQKKIKTNNFDVFLCHTSEDKAEVKRIGRRLKKNGILPWLDEWELQPGLPWQRLLEQQIGQINSAAVFVGKKGIGPWQQEELEAFLSEFVRRGCAVIPVLLKDAPEKPQLPLFLKGRTWVDFREQDPNPLLHLIWGITGSRSKA